MTLMAGATIAGGVAAYGGIKAQAQAQSNLYQYQAQAAQTQQQIVANTANANITAVQDQAAEEATLLSRNQAILKGAQTAAEGAQGIAGSVTAADIAKDTLTKQQMDMMVLHYNANVKTWDITNQRNNQIWALGAQAGQSQLAAANVKTAGDISATSSLLSTASQVGYQGYLLSR